MANKDHFVLTNWDHFVLPYNTIIYHIFEYYIYQGSDIYFYFKSDPTRKKYNFRSVKIYTKKTTTQIPKSLDVHYLEIHNNTISKIPDNLKVNKLEIYGTNTIYEIPDICNIKDIIIRNQIDEIIIPKDYKIWNLIFYGIGYNDIYQLITYGFKYVKGKKVSFP